MADFCLECTLDVFPELAGTGENDLAGLCEPGETTWAVCEGYGPGWFDFTGQRVAMPPDVASILTITQAAVQATETAFFQLMLAAPTRQWATALKRHVRRRMTLLQRVGFVKNDETHWNVP